MLRLGYILLCSFLLMGVPASSDSVKKLERTIAAFSIFDFAIESENGARATLAVELLASVGAGVAPLRTKLDQFASEARFLSRGDIGLLARLDAALAMDRSEWDIHVFSIVEGLAAQPLAGSRERAIIATYPPMSLVGPQQGSRNCATRPLSPLWDCRVIPIGVLRRVVALGGIVFIHFPET